MVINLVISIALVRPLGISGVIIGTLIGYGITAPLYIRLALNLLSMGAGEFVREAILPVLVWALVFAALLAATAWFVQPAAADHDCRVLHPGGHCLRCWAVARFAIGAEERGSLFGFLRPVRRAP